MAYQNHSAKIANATKPVIGSTSEVGKMRIAYEAMMRGNIYSPSHPLYEYQQDYIGYYNS